MENRTRQISLAVTPIALARPIASRSSAYAGFSRHPVRKHDSVSSAAPAPRKRSVLGRNGIIAIRGWLILILALTTVTGCGNERNRAQSPAAGHTYSNDFRTGSYGSDGRDVLRIKKDVARNRLWVLTLEGVRVYDAERNRLIQELALPNWSVARITCRPDMVLDSSGSAIISGNAQARLWRIDADSFELTEHEIRLLDREQWDTGFSALVFGKDGALFAATSFGGSLWKIDPGRASARMVELDTPLQNACTLTAAAAGDQGAGPGITVICIDRDNNRRIEISSDFTRGRVIDAPCNNAR